MDGGNRARRSDPSVLWPEVRSIMMLAMNYGPDANPLAILEKRDRAAISVYAQNRDYHDIIKGKLKHVASRFAARAGQDVKVFVDTAPVMEKPLAEAAGLGWQGKHTNLVSRELGSWLFLGSIFTTAEIPPDAPERDHCGSCRACLDACPTKAFPRLIASTQGAAFPISPSRTRGRSRTNSVKSWATASMAATIAFPSALGTSLRKRPAK